MGRKSKFVRSTITFDQKCLRLTSHIDNSAQTTTPRYIQKFPPIQPVLWIWAFQYQAQIQIRISFWRERFSMSSSRFLVLSAIVPLLCLAVTLPGAVAEEQELNCYGDRLVALMCRTMVQSPPPSSLLLLRPARRACP